MYVLAKGRSIVALDAATGTRAVVARERRRGRHARHELLEEPRRQRGAAAVRQRRLPDRDRREDRRHDRDRSATTAASTCASASTTTSRRFVRLQTTSNPGRIFEDLIIMSLPAGGGGYASSPADIHAYNVRTGALHVDLPHGAAPRRARRRHLARRRPRQLRRRAQLERVDGRRRDRHRSTCRPARRATTSTAAIATARISIGNSLLALDARSGKLLWHFQTIHHDLWDYDLPTAPKLLTIQHDGADGAGRRAAEQARLRLRVQPRSRARRSGRSRSGRCRSRDVPGEQSWPTQPFPTAPPPFARQRSRKPTSIRTSRKRIRRRFASFLKSSRNEGLYTPPSLQGTIHDARAQRRRELGQLRGRSA